MGRVRQGESLGNSPGECSGEVQKCLEDIQGRFPMHDYKSVHAAAMIYATLISTLTASDRLYY